MEVLELPAMLVALLLSFGVIIAKVMVTQLMARMNRQINQVAEIKSEAQGRLKSAQGQKSVVAKNKTMLERKKKKVEKQMGRLKQEMSEMKDEEDARRKRSEARRVS